MKHLSFLLLVRIHTHSHAAVIRLAASTCAHVCEMQQLNPIDHRPTDRRSVQRSLRVMIMEWAGDGFALA